MHDNHQIFLQQINTQRGGICCVRMSEDEIINNMSEQSEGCANSPEPRELH
jgi:hypothetical protein